MTGAIAVLSAACRIALGRLPQATEQQKDERMNDYTRYNRTVRKRYTRTRRPHDRRPARRAGAAHTHQTEYAHAYKRPWGRFAFIAFIVLVLAYLAFSALRNNDLSWLYTFNTVLISILVQAFPFVLIGVLVSSVMHVFVPDSAIVRAFTERRALGYLTALFAGVLFPVCECAVVPVITQMVKKGVSVPIAFTFMLSAPIVNPIAIVSTLYAFPGRPEIAFYRVCFGLAIALAAGFCIRLLFRHDVLIKEAEAPDGCRCAHGHAEHGKLPRLRETALHAGEEFFSVGKYLIAGACIAALIQVTVPRDAFTGLLGAGGSLLIMMAAAFLFSACSTSDAFIARSFLNRFSLGSVLGFMVFGPMLDLKNMFMLLSGFKKGFVLRLALLVTVLNFAALYFLTSVFLR